MLTNRRRALKIFAASVATTCLTRIVAWSQTSSASSGAKVTGPFTLPALPYGYDALEPYIDVETMHLHHDKHHAAYVAKLNEAAAKEPSVAAAKVEDLLKNLDAVPESVRTVVRNNGGGHANHSLFWQTLGPKSTSRPSAQLSKALDSDLGGYDTFQAALIKAGLAQFGSGWTWLILDANKKLSISATPNQDSPLSVGKFPIFGIDVWEHAYYLKYHNLRADYLKAIWNVLNWDFISARYADALQA